MDAARMRTAIDNDRLAITSISPTVDGGRYPARFITDQVVRFAATAFREGHDAIGVQVVLQRPGGTAVRVLMHPDMPGTDRWVADIELDAEGAYRFRIEAFSDPWATWCHAVTAKLDDGQDAAQLSNDLATGTELLRQAAHQAPEHAPVFDEARALLSDRSRTVAERVGAALDPQVSGRLQHDPIRQLLTSSDEYHLWVDRPRAAVGSWYELFPRSTGGLGADGQPLHGTFDTAAADLGRIAAMGFDVVYLPPIHPIGEVNRKGPNNSLVAGPSDYGSPWAVGSAAGGHDAVHPALGGMEAFERFVARAGEHGIEVALDLALQCAPDHPWVAEHPEWFTTLADGTIAYAENPPKKYQDIYPLNFDNAPETLYAEVYRVVRFWVERGVQIFRVDNPHTKPVNFWHWLIWEIKRDFPGVIFLAEAFTRPPMVKGLAMRGFSQSYTYFTWRTGKQELEELGRDFVASSAYFNPNLFVNTPDILHESLQNGGPAMFKIRAVLALMSGSWGMYSGYELFEHTPLRPGSEEYLDSEKYQLRPRDWRRAREQNQSLEPFITTLNAIRATHPALRSTVANLVFHHSDNDNIIVFSRRDAATGDTVIVCCSLEGRQSQQTTVRLNLAALGLAANDRFTVQDHLTGEAYDWGEANFVELVPDREPAHVLRLLP